MSDAGFMLQWIPQENALSIIRSCSFGQDSRRMPSDYFVSSQINYSQDVQPPPGAGWGECLGTEWQLNSGKIKLLKGNSRKIYLRYEVLVWPSSICEKATLSRMKANSFVFVV